MQRLFQLFQRNRQGYVRIEEGLDDNEKKALNQKLDTRKNTTAFLEEVNTCIRILEKKRFPTTWRNLSLVLALASTSTAISVGTKKIQKDNESIAADQVIMDNISNDWNNNLFNFSGILQTCYDLANGTINDWTRFPELDFLRPCAEYTNSLFYTPDLLIRYLIPYCEQLLKTFCETDSDQFWKDDNKSSWITFSVLIPAGILATEGLALYLLKWYANKTDKTSIAQSKLSNEDYQFLTDFYTHLNLPFPAQLSLSNTLQQLKLFKVEAEKVLFHLDNNKRKIAFLSIKNDPKAHLFFQLLNKEDSKTMSAAPTANKEEVDLNEIKVVPTKADPTKGMLAVTRKIFEYVDAPPYVTNVRRP